MALLVVFGENPFTHLPTPINGCFPPYLRPVWPTIGRTRDRIGHTLTQTAFSYAGKCVNDEAA